MQCREIDNLIMKYLDGNISELEMEQIIRHKEKCAKCAMEFELLSEAIYTLEDMPDIEVPEGFEVRVMEKIKNQKPAVLTAQVMLLWIIGLAGMSIFMINVFSLVLLPLLKNSGVLLIAYNTMVYAGSILTNFIKEFFITISLFISRLLVSKDALLRNYLIFAASCAALLVTTNITIFKKLRAHQKQ